MVVPFTAQSDLFKRSNSYNRWWTVYLSKRTQNYINLYSFYFIDYKRAISLPRNPHNGVLGMETDLKCTPPPTNPFGNLLLSENIRQKTCVPIFENKCKNKTRGKQERLPRVRVNNLPIMICVLGVSLFKSVWNKKCSSPWYTNWYRSLSVDIRNRDIERVKRIMFCWFSKSYGNKSLQTWKQSHLT